ncbi:MAG: hypothetical protein GU357_01985 [Thermofilum sp.]|nr:hypothetical protein [Thermofilum sp.]
MAEKLHESGIEDSWNSIDRVLASLNILRIVTNSLALRTWLREYHGISNFDELLEGYKSFIITAFKFVLHAVATDYALGLKEDDVLFRVIYYVDVNLEDIPHNCEKTVFLKNIWNLSRGLRRAKSWDELDKTLRELRPLFEIFDFLYRKSRVTCKISKKEALKGITLLYANRFFVDSSNGFPRGLTLTPSTRSTITWQYLNQNFKGYAYTLEFLFFNLLDRDTFEQLKLKEMHNPSKVFSRKTKENPSWKILLPELLEEESASSAEWYALGNFYQVVKTKIIIPFEAKLGRALGLNPLFILAPGSVDKSVFKSLLSKKNLQNPQYIYKKDRESLMKKLDYHLLWYKVYVLDGSSAIFSGVPAFISTLLGLVLLNKRYGSDVKVKVRIFKHPRAPDENFYSFAVLVPTFSTFFADLSGWLVYYDCATDFSGFGGSLFMQAKIHIDALKSKDLVEVEEISVDKEIFKEYLKERSYASVFDTIVLKEEIFPGERARVSFSEIKRRLKEFLARYKGTIFEYIVYYWLNESKHKGKVKLNTRVGKEEIDCIHEDEDVIEMYECKFTLHTDKIGETIDQIKRKVSALNKVYSNSKRVVPILVVYNVGSSEHIKKIKEQGINVIMFRDIINQNRIFVRKREDLMKILDEDLGFRIVDELHHLE